MKKSRLLAAVAVAGVMAASAVNGAQADPTGSPTFRTLAGVGSDTTENVMNDMSNAIVDGGGIKITGSYNATGSATISTKAAANCTNVPRPNGSSAGRTALSNSLAPGAATAGCFQFSRSSSLNTAGIAGGASRQLTYIPYAYDYLGFAVTAGSIIPKILSKIEVQSIYNCEIPGFKALIPQAGSGTRSAWLSYLGLNEASLATRPCISATINGSPVQEHNGIPLDNESIVPYSVGKWNQQAATEIPDVHGNTVLGILDGTVPNEPNTTFAGKREIYNVIATTNETVAPFNTVFVGPTSAVCSNTAIIKANAFGVNPNCGSTALKTTLTP